MSEVFVLALLLCNFGSTLARYWLALDIRIEGILARRNYWNMCIIFKFCLYQRNNMPI